MVTTVTFLQSISALTYYYDCLHEILSCISALTVSITVSLSAAVTVSKTEPVTTVLSLPM